jgi:hypothetical protein
VKNCKELDCLNSKYEGSREARENKTYLKKRRPKIDQTVSASGEYKVQEGCQE